ncbi:hypothetical protein J6J08_08315 [Pseudidiomarina sp. 1APR75-33.1]|uniref:hypothetical protein n=1 Tax=Pseudidiomarina terrestris TaxID=2820060 RepID=UPI00264C1435|nr:hypothetical protein [Pseudidiomarina sp. 1APR75-33.1]MDN7127385.1 hypothetical protein [Pseudidiomarina sp. 1APR75-33.1]
MDLFQLISDDELNHCIQVWMRATSAFSIANSVQGEIEQLKLVLAESSRYDEMLAEALSGLGDHRFCHNETLINEAFTYLDEQLEKYGSSSFLH